jgi:ubiquinone/menaquinone biosynthesis C-methylase UbiE
MGMTRQEKILSCIDPAMQRGLEIGALNRPIVTREMGNVRYVDHASTEELRQKYVNDPGVAIESIVDVSYVWGTQTLPELVGGDAPFDYVVASHVIEHVPDLIGWLKEIHAVLNPGGVLTLAIPDKRCCFDFHRPLTQATSAIEAYLERRRKPSSAQIFEFLSSVASWNNQFVWDRSAVGHESEVIRAHSVAEAWQMTNQIAAAQEYYDIHCWVFTPASFFALLKVLIQASLFDFQVVQFYETTGCEFFVSLAAMDLTKDLSERQAIQMEGLSVNHQSSAKLATSEQLPETTKELQREQINLARVRSNLKRVRADKQRLKNKVITLQSRLNQLEAEMVALQSSRLWKMREKWLRLKRVFRFESSHPLSEVTVQTSSEANVVPTSPDIQSSPIVESGQTTSASELIAKLDRLEAENQVLKHEVASFTAELQLLQRKTADLSPILWRHPSEPMSPPLPLAKELIVSESQAHQLDLIPYFKQLIPKMGNTVQAELLTHVTEAELLQFLQNDQHPLPHPYDREGYCGEQHSAYWVMGLGDYLFLTRRIADQYHLRNQSSLAFLDLGCASGRVLRHFAAHDPNIKVYGTDISAKNIAWIKRYLPGKITAFQDSVMPHLPLEENSLDLVYAGSVFTHINDHEETWLLELKRILKPGGMALLTIHSDRTWRQIHQNHFIYKHFTASPHWIQELNTTDISPSLFAEEMPLGKIVFIATNYPINNTNVFHSVEYIKSEWSKFFEVVDIIPKAHGEHQDGVLLRKK